MPPVPAPDVGQVVLSPRHHQVRLHSWMVAAAEHWEEKKANQTVFLRQILKIFLFNEQFC